MFPVTILLTTWQFYPLIQFFWQLILCLTTFLCRSFHSFFPHSSPFSPSPSLSVSFLFPFPSSFPLLPHLPHSPLIFSFLPFPRLCAYLPFPFPFPLLLLFFFLLSFSFQFLCRHTWSFIQEWLISYFVLP